MCAVARVLAIVALGGCGRLSFDPRSDAARDGVAMDTADVLDAFVIPPATPFGNPSLVGNVNDGALDDIDPSMTGDQLELYFVRGDASAGMLDIFVATRASVTDAWGTPAMVPELSSGVSDDSPEVRPDGLEIWLASRRAGTAGGSDLWIATRAQRTDPWGTPARVAALSSTADDYSPSFSADRLAVAFDSSRNGSPSLYVATRATLADAWSTPRQVTELDVVTWTSTDPAISADGLTLFYASGTSPNVDLYSTSRPSRTATFAAPQKHGELSVRAGNFDPWLSADSRYIIYAADPPGGGFDLYEATR